MNFSVFAVFLSAFVVVFASEDYYIRSQHGSTHVFQDRYMPAASSMIYPVVVPAPRYMPRYVATSARYNPKYVARSARYMAAPSVTSPVYALPQAYIAAPVSTYASPLYTGINRYGSVFGGYGGLGAYGWGGSPIAYAVGGYGLGSNYILAKK